MTNVCGFHVRFTPESRTGGPALVQGQADVSDVGYSGEAEYDNYTRTN